MTRLPPPGSLWQRLVAGGLDIRGKDGRCYHLRPIRPDDAGSLMRGYEALPERAKWFRMLHAVPHLTPEMAAHFCTTDPERDCCVVAEGREALAGEILGGARIVGEADGLSAEFSVSMRPEAQGLGLARQCLETVLKVAAEMGYGTVWGLIASDNSDMLRLAERIGFSLRRDPDDLSMVRAEIQPRC